MNFKITPKNTFKTYLKYGCFLMALVLIFVPFIVEGYEVLMFFGLIFIILGLVFTMFNSKKSLRIHNNQIDFESKSIVKEFSKSTTIKFEDIKDVYFLERQFLFFGGRSPIADADAQTLYNENRMVFALKNHKSEVIMQVGKLKDFKKAFSIIKQEISKNE